ncbi:hypothetical protein GCM10025865_14700 [Paraoerskovia sediminicola]|uniref:Uncharacterized protein n=2 Tax=Paraoerskovia sediminicola TaxID=1138587 RepID=A0ABN6XBG5_9CELL|nr:hypothetical protein GCM10025865_14700 [Paraoerskovia sediminicola]
MAAGTRVVGAGAGLLVALPLAACAPVGDGPLAGPRVAADDVELCVPTTAGEHIYFGEALANGGSDPAVISDVRGTAERAESVDFSIDQEGLSLDEVLGGGGWPTDEPVGFEADALGRAVPVEGVVVDPGAAVTLIAVVEPTSATDDAIVDDIIVTYTSGDEEYEEHISVAYRVHHGDSC